MRILHVTPYAPDAWAYGGIPRLAGTLARGLARRGHDVTVCTTDVADATSRLSPHEDSRDEARSADAGRAKASRFGAWPARRHADGVEFRVFPNLSNRLAYRHQLFWPIGLNGYLRTHARQFDIAHLHACRNRPGALAARHLRRAGVPYVLAPNGTAPRLERRRLAKHAYDAFVGHRVMRGAARVLAVSGAERGQLHDLGVAPDAIRVIPNPLDLDEFSTPIVRGTFRERHGLPDTRIVLFLGKLTPRKRVDALIRAFARLERTDARLVIAGNDMGSGHGLRALVRAHGLQHRTLFTGLLRGRDRLEALADAHVLVYPSQHEIFGLVPLEALLSHTPVVVADDCGCGEVIASTGGGLVTPLGDVAALTQAIERLLDAPSQWRLAAAAAAIRVRASYASDIVCSQIDEMYAEIAGPTR